MKILPDPILPHQEAHLLIHRPILVAYRGSIAHGTYIAPSEPNGIDDRDIISVYIPHLSHYFGLDGREWTGRERRIGDWDAVNYELRHYVHLLSQQNPNVLSLLWTKNEHILSLTYEGGMLRGARDLFRSKRAYQSFGGYAKGQLHRMTHWNDAMFHTGELGAKRKALVEKYGYDCKNAAHLIRLLSQGIEFLNTGEIIVDRRDAGDAENLIAVKTGKLDLVTVKDMATELSARLDEAYARCTFPESVDQDKATELLLAILSRAHIMEVADRNRNASLETAWPQNG